MEIEMARSARARLLQASEPRIAAEALAAGPESVVLVVDRAGELERALARLAAPQPDADLPESEATSEFPDEHSVVVAAVDRKRLVKATRALWPRLVARYGKAPADGAVWVLVVAHGGATLASYPRCAAPPGRRSSRR